MASRLRSADTSLDAVDGRILDALDRDGRMSLADLARRVGLSPPSVAERIKRLEEAGVIEGYTAVVNLGALGLPIGAWLRVKPIPGELHNVVEMLRRMPNIVECDRITGEDCFLARAHVASLAALEELIDQIVPHATTSTSIIQSSPVKRRLPPIPRPSD